MEGKLTKFIKKECKIHGEIDFYTYKEKPYKCAICAKQGSKEWKSKNPSAVKKYNEMWKAKNPDSIKKYNKKNIARYRRIKSEKSENFHKNFGNCVKEISSSINLKKIPRAIERMEDPTKDKIFNFLIKSKRSELRSSEIFRISTLVKWEYLKSLNLRSATEEQKSIIRAEYKKRAKKIVDAEMERILENYNKNK